MAVLAKSDNVLVGLSTDVKPTNFIPGSVFYETDTDKKFEWRGGAWVELDTVAAAIGEPVANPAANTLLARIKALEDKIDDITAGTTPAKVEGEVTLSGSKVSVIYGAFAVGTSAVSKAINGKQCTVNVLSGTVWINPLDVAVADATAIKLTGAIDLVVDENLSLISDATGANVQVIVWE